MLSMIPYVLVSQELPSTQVHLLKFKFDSGQFVVEKASLLSTFNKGYNNQPSFIDPNSLLLSARFTGETTNDIVALNLAERTISKFTKSPVQSEYSPKLTPTLQEISTVRVEKDGKTQTLWLYPRDKSSTGKRILKKVNNVGYYEWLDNQHVVIFEVAEPNVLKVYNTLTEQSTLVATQPGRCIKKLNNNAFYFVSSSGDLKYLKKYDRLMQTSTIITSIGSEDFELDATGNIYCIVEDQLLIYNPRAEKPQWEAVFDLKKLNIKGANRLHVYTDLMAIVSNYE